MRRVLGGLKKSKTFCDNLAGKEQIESLEYLRDTLHSHGLRFPDYCLLEIPLSIVGAGVMSNLSVCLLGLWNRSAVSTVMQ